MGKIDWEEETEKEGKKGGLRPDERRKRKKERLKKDALCRAKTKGGGGRGGVELSLKFPNL